MKRPKSGIIERMKRMVTGRRLIVAALLASLGAGAHLTCSRGDILSERQIEKKVNAYPRPKRVPLPAIKTIKKKDEKDSPVKPEKLRKEPKSNDSAPSDQPDYEPVENPQEVAYA